MAQDFSQPAAAAVRIFGTTYTLSRLRSGGDPETFQGILDEGTEAEELAPGAGSINASMSALRGGFDRAPVVGDEVETASSVYEIVKLTVEADGLLIMYLRHDREIP